MRNSDLSSVGQTSAVEAGGDSIEHRLRGVHALVDHISIMPLSIIASDANPFIRFRCSTTATSDERPAQRSDGPADLIGTRQRVDEWRSACPRGLEPRLHFHSTRSHNCSSEAPHPRVMDTRWPNRVRVCVIVMISSTGNSATALFAPPQTIDSRSHSR